jgi:hypothetical protein
MEIFLTKSVIEPNYFGGKKYRDDNCTDVSIKSIFPNKVVPDHTRAEGMTDVYIFS